MTITGIHQQNFLTRLNVTDAATASLMNLLKSKKHFDSYRKSSKEEDLNGIDWWVVYPGQTDEIPIQFKLRDRQKDIPLCRYQPFYGTDSTKTVIGRDYRCIENKKASQYYVAVRNSEGKFTEIYKISCDTLRPLIMSLDEEWQKVEGVFDSFSLKFFDSGRVGKWLESGIWNKRVFRGDSGCEVWWKKNKNEKFPKFNMYVPHSYKDWETQLSESESNSIEHKEIATAYFHIGNGGVSFSVVDKGHGPVVKIDSSHFGNNVTSQELYVSQDDLTALARLFKVAAEYDGYSQDYCMAARIESGSPFEITEGLLVERGSGEDCCMAAGVGCCSDYCDDTGEGCDCGDYDENGYYANTGCKFYYCNEYVQNETIHCDGKSTFSSFSLEHFPVVLGSICGFLLRDEVQFAFTVDEEGIFNFETLRKDYKGPMPIGGKMVWSSGICNIVWDNPPGTHNCVLSYEYDRE